MPRALLRERVRDLLELVGAAGVLGLRVVVEVEHAALVDDDVLEHRAERARGGVDLRLRLRREADHLRVAAALEVEDAAVAPAVLVVADQVPFGVGGQRRLARAGEPEEDRDAAVVVDVRRAVHRKHALERQPVVHEREDRLLDLARVVGAADQHLGPRRVQDDERLAAGAVHRRIGLDGGCVQDERLRVVLGELVLGRVDEERLREERVPGAVRDDAQRQPVLRVGAGERVHHVQVARVVEVPDDLLAEPVEALLGQLAVHGAPPDPGLAARLADEELVVGRAAGVRAGVDDERPALGEHAVAAPDRVHVEQCRRRVPVDAPVRVEAVVAHVRAPQLRNRHVERLLPLGHDGALQPAVLLRRRDRHILRPRARYETRRRLRARLGRRPAPVAGRSFRRLFGRHRRPRRERLSERDLRRSGGRVGPAEERHGRRAGRRLATVVAGRNAHRVRLESRRQGQAAVRDRRLGRRGAAVDRPARGRARAGVVARRRPDRLLGSRTRSDLRGRGRVAPRAAPLHPRPVQARRRRVDRRPPARSCSSSRRTGPPRRSSSPPGTTSTTRRAGPRTAPSSRSSRPAGTTGTSSRTPTSTR